MRSEGEIIETMLNSGLINRISLEEFQIDIRMIAYNQLIHERIQPENISINNMCTYESKLIFHSWRREISKQRQWSCILS